ncbi:MAG: aminotransferase class I/II-fold pyridoxal phosphate-dependent enzyme [Clostridiales bacterium]|nr:aminotransferase class I/II-fold pyridoxal phosphate-dependent enzyme [Clostridiales bacterium]
MLLIDRGSDAAGTVCNALDGTNFVERLECALTDMYSRDVIALSSPDGAIHTALHLCGVGAGDYVFVPTYTFYSYIATVSNLGAVPVFIDSDPVTRCMSSSALEAAFTWAELQRKTPKAVIVDNAFGSVADYSTLYPLVRSHGAFLIELACDALGGDYSGVPCGGNGDYGILSFGKRLAGGGAALVCGGEKTAAARFTRAQYSSGESHDYRLHNIVAALSFALLGDIKKIASRGRSNLAALVSADLALPLVPGDAGAYAVCDLGAGSPRLSEMGFDVKRPPLVHTLYQYSHCTYFEHEIQYSVAEHLSKYALIGMDISTFARRKLTHILKKSNI